MAENEQKNQTPIKAGESDNLVKDLYFGSAERTEQRSPYVGDTYQAPYNPDDLFQKAGDYSLYEDMKNDDQVSVCLNLKTDLVIGSGWDIVTEKEGDTEIADDIYSRLEEDPEIAFDDSIDDYFDALCSFGFAIAEKRFGKRPDGSLTLQSLKTRHPSSWLLHTDPFGKIEKFEQHTSRGDIAIDPKSLMYCTVNNSLVGPYGKSDLRAAYEAYFVKRHIVRFYSIFLEKAASPIPVAKYDKNLTDDRVTTLHNIIKNFQTKTAITIPKEIDIEFLESNNVGDAYTKGINLFNMFIGRALLVPDLLGFTGEGSMQGGSQALGREQVQIFFKHINRRRRTLERLINKHIIYPLVVYNYGFQELYPKFQFRPISEDNATEYAKTFIEAMKGSLYKPTEDEINHFRSLINFPEGKVEFKEAGSAGGQPFGQNPFGPQPPNPPTPPKNDEGSAEDKVELEQEKKDYAYKATDGDYAKKTDFKAIEAQLDASEMTLLKELRPLVDEIFDDLYDQMRKKKIVNGLDSKLDRIDTIKLKKIKQFQNIIKKHFKESFIKQTAIARAELFKQDFAFVIPEDTYYAWLEAESFKFVGDWKYKITQAAATEMIAAVKDGRPISSVIDVVDSQGKKDSLVSVERYARTKFTEIANQARINSFKDTNLVQGYQFSAVLDSRTSYICAGLHGKKFKANEAPVPPLHWNCRSILIPITIFEEMEPDTKPNSTMMTSVRGKLEDVKIPDSSKPIGEFIKIHGGKGFVDKSGQ